MHRSPGAPECRAKYADPSTPISEVIDLWSLGCVFSIAATWVVLGYQGIQQFEKLRRNAIMKTQRTRYVHGSSEPTAIDCDWFHNGKDVLPDVISWHRVLREFLRKTDTVTSQILDLVDQKMLRPSGERLDASSVCQELKKILSRSEGEPREAIPEGIMSVLLEVDETAPSIVIKPPSETTAASEQGYFLGSPQDRKARKSSRLEFPLMKTANRSEYLKSALNAQTDMTHNPNIPHNNLAVNGETSWQNSTSMPPQSFGIHTVYEESHVQTSNDHTPERTSKDSTPRHHHRRQPSKTHEPQDVFQARQIIEARPAGFPWKKSRNDELLTKHFENRDIVSYQSCPEFPF